MQTVLTIEYHDPNVEDSTSDDACEGSQFEYMEFWCINNEKCHESSIRSNITLPDDINDAYNSLDINLER